MLIQPLLLLLLTDTVEADKNRCSFLSRRLVDVKPLIFADNVIKPHLRQIRIRALPFQIIHDKMSNCTWCGVVFPFILVLRLLYTFAVAIWCCCLVLCCCSCVHCCGLRSMEMRNTKSSNKWFMARDTHLASSAYRNCGHFLSWSHAIQQTVGIDIAKDPIRCCTNFQTKITLWLRADCVSVFCIVAEFPLFHSIPF